MNKAMTYDKLKDKRKTFLFVFLAIALVLATWYKLKIQGITMTEDISYEEVLICEKTEETHVHLPECYEKIAVISSEKQQEKETADPETETELETDINLEEADNIDSSDNTSDAFKSEELEENLQEEQTDSQENLQYEEKQEEILKDIEQNTIVKNLNSNSLMSTQPFTLSTPVTNNIALANEEPVTPVEEVAPITINYIVDTTPEATGYSIDYRYVHEEKKINIDIPTVQGVTQTNAETIYKTDANNIQVPYTKTTYSATINYNNGSTIANLSNQYMTPYHATETDSLDRFLLRFKGWKINNSDIVIQAGTELKWEDLESYAKDGVINLTATWKNDFTRYEYANFFINYASEALDVGGNTEIYDESLYTPSLWASYVGNVTAEDTEALKPITDITKDNSFKADKEIRQLEGFKER